MLSRCGVGSAKSTAMDFLLRLQNEARRASDAFGGERAGAGCSSLSLLFPLASDPRFKNEAVVPSDSPRVRRLSPTSERETSIATGGSKADVVRSLWELFARRILRPCRRGSDAANATVLTSEVDEEADALRIA